MITSSAPPAACAGRIVQTIFVADLAILELVAIQPITIVPAEHVRRAERLRRQGLVLNRDDRWYPTATGLIVVGRTIH